MNSTDPTTSTSPATSTDPSASTGPTTGTEEPSFTIVRDFAAPRPQVWEAWTNPDVMARWFHPETLVTPRESVSVDLQVGGTYTYTMRIPGTGQEFPTAGKYRHIEPPRRLDFTWGSPGDVDDSPLVSVVLDEIDADTTRMTFTVTGIPNDSGSDASAYDGWTSAFNVYENEVIG